METKANLIKLIFTLRHHRKNIGTWNIFRLFYFQHYAKHGKLFVINYKNKNIWLRSRSTDILVFFTVMLEQQYPIFYNYKPRIIIDAGANIGLATILFKLHYPEAKVISIEPDEENCKLFKQNTEGLPDIYLLHGGIWTDSENKLKIRNPEAGSYSFQLEKSNEGMSSYTISDIMTQFKIDYIDILKLDIEGSERELFLANTEWLKQVGNIMIETHDHYAPGASQALLSAVAHQGFNLSTCGENIIFTREIHKRVV